MDGWSEEEEALNFVVATLMETTNKTPEQWETLYLARHECRHHHKIPRKVGMQREHWWCPVCIFPVSRA